MPPPNSANESPTRVSEEISPYLQQLEVISSPVPNFAATLMTPDEQEINDANVGFLRTRIPEREEEAEAGETTSGPVDYHTLLDWYTHSADRSRERIPAMSHDQPGRQEERNLGARARSSHQSLRELSERIAARRREMHRISTTNRHGYGHGHEEDNNYANRTPHRQSLYDWAPYFPIDDDDDEHNNNNNATHVMRHGAEDDDLPSYASYARYRWLERRQHYEQSRSDSTQSRRQPRDEPSGRTTLSSLTEALRRETTPRRQENPPNQALLHQVERYRRGQNRARAVWQGSTNGLASRGDSGMFAPLHRPEQQAPNHRSTDHFHYPVMSGSRNVIRQKFLEDPSLMRVREVMRYLSELRHYDSAEQALLLAKSHYLCDESENSLDSSMVQGLCSFCPKESSWLLPGATFQGTQSAPLIPDEAPVFIHQPSRGTGGIRFVRDDGVANTTATEASSNIRITTSSGRRYIADQASELPQPPAANLAPEPEEPNSWPVTVTLDSLSLSSMTLTGTMSASKIRDKRSPTGESSSTTFFDGEIIDFSTHTLETENFESEGLETDVMYWMRIGPFRGMNESEVAQSLLSRRWIEENLVSNWILMRWKERSFIPPTPSPNPGGISIRGFYYVALNRQTGVIDGSYGNHPDSQPYQRLIMRPYNCPHLADDEDRLEQTGTKAGACSGIGRRLWFPAYEFR